jgi:putative peptidoglycan lipid II flippase
MVNNGALMLGVLALFGAALCRPILRMTAPGLPEETLALAATIAQITWPGMLATGLSSLISGTYQVQGKFAWPAACALLGSFVTLVTLLLLRSSLGIVGAAVSILTGGLAQVVLLSIGRLRHYRFELLLRTRAIQDGLKLLGSLAFLAVFTRWLPVLDRYLASTLPLGSISHLGYALKIQGLFSSLLAGGFATVAFPEMALRVAAGDLDGLRRTFSQHLRTVLLFTVAAMAITIVLAEPLIAVLLERGSFTPSDTTSVALLLRVYMVGLCGAALGCITGRTFYALKKMRWFTIGSIAEVAAYAIYTPALAKHYGTVGIATSSSCMLTISIVWHSMALWKSLGSSGGRQILASSCRIVLAGLSCALAAWIAANVVGPGHIVQVATGSLVGLMTYAVVLVTLRSPELSLMSRGIVDGMGRFAPFVGRN